MFWLMVTLVDEVNRYSNSHRKIIDLSYMTVQREGKKANVQQTRSRTAILTGKVRSIWTKTNNILVK